MDGNPARSGGEADGLGTAAGPDSAASVPDDVSPWPRTGEFTFSYQPPPTDFGGGFLASETSAIPLGPLYMQTPYRDPADDVAPPPPPAYQGQAHSQIGHPPPPYPEAPTGDAARYEPVPSPWLEQPAPWPPAPPEQPGWPPYGDAGTYPAPGQASVPAGTSADYGIPPPAPYGQWGYEQPDQGAASPDPGSWFAPADTGAIPIGPPHEPAPPHTSYQHPTGTFAGPPTQPLGPYQDQFAPGTYGQSAYEQSAYGQSPPYTGQPDPDQPHQVAGYQLEFYAYQRTIYQQPPGGTGGTPFPAAADPATQTGAFPIYYAPPPTDLGGGGFAATDTSAIPIMPAAPVWSDGLSPAPTAPDLTQPDLASPGAPWPYPAWPAEAGDPWPATAATAPEVTAAFPAGAWTDSSPPYGPAGGDSPADGSVGDPPASGTAADQPAASNSEPANGPAVRSARPGGRRARRRRRRAVLLVVCCLVAAAIAGTVSLRLVATGDDQGDKDTLAAGTPAPGAAQPRATRTYPFPVIPLTQRGAASAPSPSAVGTLPPGGAFGQAVGSPVFPLSVGATPSVGKPPAPAEGAAPTATVTPAARGNFPPAPPAPFPVPGA
ncbi:hypothetical protein [Pseudofrankia sp. BMG5.36]|uniref:hypothetical protein n=1 Tax=Pseudofrankia sp. BMG5.36 TaxID=1834512 RepID=UPI0008D8FBD4|nr:hypothetical protein [Pseudofrankia sp. BMG5.36]OHV49334.1 hypothetical protein BCD48_12840 [Pseudofrankia sp. BMG5.36]